MEIRVIDNVKILTRLASRVRILVQVTIYCRIRIGRDAHLVIYYHLIVTIMYFRVKICLKYSSSAESMGLVQHRSTCSKPHYFFCISSFLLQR